MDYNNSAIIIMTDAHRFLAQCPTFEKTLELWSYNSHWAPNEHQLQTSLSNKPNRKGTAIANPHISDWPDLSLLTYLVPIEMFKHFEHQTCHTPTAR